jgi:predicted flavoprotein YhiN
MAIKVIKKIKPSFYDVVIIGGGPAGLMSACIASKNSKKVLLIEKNEIMGKKLLLTGGGRCNITNAEPDHRKFVSKFGKKGNLLFTPFSIFGVDDSIRFFEDLGLKTKIEEGYRVFPKSDNSIDVLGTLVKSAKNNGVEFMLEAEVSHIKVFSGGLPLKRNKVTPGTTQVATGQAGKGETSGHIESIILINGNEIKAKSFILATGGKSHPETGSTGDGLIWLKEIGHNVIASNPSLVPISVKEGWISELSGITLDDIGISVYQGDSPEKILADGKSKIFRASVLKTDVSAKTLTGRKVINKKGRILFTHTGLSGPTILNMSKDIGELLDYSGQGLSLTDNEVKVCIDFFPKTGLDVMHKMFLDTFEKNKNKKIKNIIFPEVPSQIFLKILDVLGIDPDWNVNEITREERFSILEKFKKFDLTVKGLLGYDKAIVSSGGVDLVEVDMKEMKSKLFDNLFFAGDILDFDRPSGGYSLQLCWTTGYIAGKSSIQ